MTHVTDETGKKTMLFKGPSQHVRHLRQGGESVAHFVRTFAVPTETFVVNQIRSTRKYRPVVFCRHESGASDPRIADVLSIDTLVSQRVRQCEDISYRVSRRLTPGGSSAVLRALSEISPAVLHLHFLVDARFFLSVLKRSAVPKIVSAYGYDVSSFPRRFMGYGKSYLKSLYEHVDLVLAMSEDMRRDLVGIGVPREKIWVHYYGSEVMRFYSPERVYRLRPPFEILCVGRLIPRKGQHYLLSALQQVVVQRPDIQFTVTFVGSGPLEDRLRETVRRAGWPERVNFAGHIPHNDEQLVLRYRKADLFVHFSTADSAGGKEGIPGTIVEAMASGLPVISTFHAGIPEVISDGINGILLREDQHGALASAIIRILSDAELRERLGRAAAKTAAADLDLVKRTECLERIYDDVRQATTQRRSGGSAC